MAALPAPRVVLSCRDAGDGWPRALATVNWIILCCLPPLRGAIMPGVRSYVHALKGGKALTVAQARRLERDAWYRTVHSQPGKRFVEVWGQDRHDVRQMIKGKELHRALDAAAPSPAASGKVAAYRAWKDGRLTKGEYKSARGVMESADRGKHVHSALLGRLGPQRTAWADLDDSADDGEGPPSTASLHGNTLVQHVTAQKPGEARLQLCLQHAIPAPAPAHWFAPGVWVVAGDAALPGDAETAAEPGEAIDDEAEVLGLDYDDLCVRVAHLEGGQAGERNLRIEELSARLDTTATTLLQAQKMSAEVLAQQLTSRIWRPLAT